jgi:hypothetical protein
MSRVATTTPPKRAKVLHVTAAATLKTGSCLIYEIPIEVMEMIIANINPVDLINFISASKVIQVDNPPHVLIAVCISCLSLLSTV